ncbi:hypothetical protein NMG60_11028718 [Bertholletia excelsa]
MDKNKNRSDLLAAGRKKLQQFRQKKDNKGSTSSAKAGKSERKDDADMASAAVKSAAVLVKASDDGRSLQDLDAKEIDSSMAHSMDNAEANFVHNATADPLPETVVAEAVTITGALASDVELPPENTRLDESTMKLSVGKEQDRFGSTITDSDEGVSPTSSGNSKSVISDMSSIHSDIPVVVDSSPLPDLVGATKPVTITDEAERVCRAGQATDIGPIQGADCLALKQDDRSSGGELERDVRLDLPMLESAESCASIAPGDASKEAIVELDQTNKVNDVSASAGATNDGKEALPVDACSLELLAVNHEVGVNQTNNEAVTSLNEEKSDMSSAEWVETDILGKVINVDGSLLSKGHGKQKPIEGRMINLSHGAHAISLSMAQLMEVLRSLDEEEFQLLVTSRELAANTEFKSTCDLRTNAEFNGTCLVEPDYKFSDVMGRLKEQLYFSNYSKDVYLMQLDEQSELQMESDQQLQQLFDEMSTATALSSKVKERNESLAEELAKCKAEFQAVVCQNEELEKKCHTANAEFAEICNRVNGLQAELEKSHAGLSDLSTELSDCRGLLVSLQVENDNLKQHLALTVEDKMKLAEDKEYLVLDNEKLVSELAECKALLTSLQVENVNLNGSIATSTEERRKLEELKENCISENEKLLTDLVECRVLLEAFLVENAKLNESLSSVMHEKEKLEEVDGQVVTENKKLSMELAECKTLIEVLEVENHQVMDCLKEATLRLEQLNEEKVLSSHSRADANRVESIDLPSQSPQQASDADRTDKFCKEETELVFPKSVKSSHVHVDESLDGQLKLDASDTCLGLIGLKEHFEKAEKIIQTLENAIEGMHFHSMASSKSSEKMVRPAVSRLIQAYESKSCNDDSHVEEVPSSENQSLVGQFMLTKEQTRNLRAVLEQLLLGTMNATELFKVERDHRMLSDSVLGELKVANQTLEEQDNIFEAANVELIVLYEFIKQHLCDIDARKGALLVLYEEAMQQHIYLEADNKGLVKKLGDYESHILKLVRQLDEMHSCSDEMASSILNQVEDLHKEVVGRVSMPVQEWNSIVGEVSLAVGKLDMLVGSSFSSTLLTENSDGLDIGSHVAVSMDAAIKLIEDLQKKLEVSGTDLEAMSNSYEDMLSKFNDLHGKNELIVGVLQRIYSDLKNFVNDSCGYVEENQVVKQNEDMDPLHLHNYDIVMEQLAMFLDERLQLKSVNNKLNSELISKAKEIEELKNRCVDLDSILMLVEDVDRAVKRETAGTNSDKLESRLHDLISFLFEKYKEANEQVSLSREAYFSNEMKLSELQLEIEQLSFLIVQHENEILVLKESLRQGAEDLGAVRAELQEKVNELEQSEQRLSSIREKLSIAVSKGKGLIIQRDNLKQSLAETSIELDKCSQELQLKDARILEVEAKLKTYSEAGERVEALESELSYIRNSATALRESFLLKDSVLQRIEEILEDLELPENFHSRDIIEKVDWLAQSVTGNSLPITEWDQKSPVGDGTYSDTGFVNRDAGKEDAQPSSHLVDDLKRKYEELQTKFYGLAEQNEMLEQSLMERNNVVQRWEGILERINMPLQLRSMEPEDRIEWLGTALSEAHHHCDALQQKVDYFENYCGTLSADLEGSQKRLCDIETVLQAVTHEKDDISGSLEIITRDYERVSEKAVRFEHENGKLQNEVFVLEEKLAEKVWTEEHIERIEGNIRRLESLISNVLEDSVTDVVSEPRSTEYLEQLLQKLVEKYEALSLQKPILADLTDVQDVGTDDSIQYDRTDSEHLMYQDSLVLKKELEGALHELMCVKEERDIFMDKNQSLACDVQVLEVERQELQELLSQEEQKSASLREKLNVAVRKGKSLVQQRDSLKQTIEEVNREVERLKSEMNIRESTLSDYEQKVQDLSTYKERVEVIESESLFLRNRLAETEYILQGKINNLSLILNTLNDIDDGSESKIDDPVLKLEQMGKQLRDLHAAVASSEHDLKKSKRAAELLLAELNEVQERNDGLQEELEKAANELSELSKERDLAEAARSEAISTVQKLSAVHSEEINNQFAEFRALKSCFDQLRKVFFDVNDLIGSILSKDLDYLHNLEITMMSSLEPNEALSVVGQPLGGSQDVISINVENKERFLAAATTLDSKMKEHVDGIKFVEIYSSFGHQFRDFMNEIGVLKEELCKHVIRLNERAKHVCELAGTVHREVTSQRQSLESMMKSINQSERIEKEKDTERDKLHRYIALLYEACHNSIVEIENWKAQYVENYFPAADLGLSLESEVSGGSLYSLLSSEEGVRAMANRLLSVVKDFSGNQSKIIEDGKKELEISISNLQKEIQDKDIQKDRICVELVSQIKEAEATARNYLQDLQSAKAQISKLEKQSEMMEEERKILEQRLTELEDGKTSLEDSNERVRSLSDALAAKEQEIEALMQALDEEETQMEDLTKKIGELEQVLQKKNLELENLEASRGKAMKKLTITVNKFDELHHLSASLLSEVEKLQSQLQERDAEISFLRQEVTRCTSEALVASQTSNKRNSDEICELLTWLESKISEVQVHDVHCGDEIRDQSHEYKEIFKKQIMSLVSEMEGLRAMVHSGDMLLQAEKNIVQELTHKGENLEKTLHKRETQLARLQEESGSGQTGSTASEIAEVDTVINKRTVPGTSIAPQVRSLRKVNNDQVAIAIDMDSGSGGLEDEDDDKAHGFKSLTTSKIVPRFTRPVTDMVDGLWVSCDRTLMRQPALRLGVIIYWALLHALLATFVV